MARPRKELSFILKRIQGNENVYFQPPETIKMEYDAIVYSVSNIDIRRADNKAYSTYNKYTLICISRKKENPVVQRLIEELPMCSYDRGYVKNNLYYEVLTVYF